METSKQLLYYRYRIGTLGKNDLVSIHDFVYFIYIYLRVLELGFFLRYTVRKVNLENKLMLFLY